MTLDPGGSLVCPTAIGSSVGVVVCAVAGIKVVSHRCGFGDYLFGISPARLAARGAAVGFFCSGTGGEIAIETSRAAAFGFLALGDENVVVCG